MLHRYPALEQPSHVEDAEGQYEEKDADQRELH